MADPAELGSGDSGLDPAEKARRERSREQAAGIVSFSCDTEMRLAVFGLAGRVYAADLAGDGGAAASVRQVPARAPAADPAADPAGQLVAYACAGALRVTDLRTGEDRAVAAPDATDAADAADAAGNVTFGLAEFIAAEEMRRAHGFWWAPDSTALLVARVDESPVQRWYIADPSNPGQPVAQVRYPAAGTPNAEVSLVLVGLDGRPTPVGWDSAAFPYLVTAVWAGAGQAAASPLIVVQDRYQREMRILAVDRQTGATTVLRADTDPHWLDIIPGVPALTASGRIVWTADTGGAHRLIVATAADLSNGRALPVTPERAAGQGGAER